MYPNLFATSLHPRMRCLPTFKSRILDWLPIDIAAQTISELLIPQGSPSKKPKGKKKEQNQSYHISHEQDITYTVHNIVNPQPIPWSSLLSMIQSYAQTRPLEEVPISEWVERLTSLADDGLNANDLPGLRLLGFFERLAEEEENASGGGDKIFETAKTRELSPSLRDCGPICKEWIEKSLDVWKRDGFIKI